MLVGGKGADSFVFGAARESRPAPATAGRRRRRRRLRRPGQRGGDLIDLRGIDADTTRAGDQAFAFGAAHGRGHLWLDDAEKVT